MTKLAGIGIWTLDNDRGYNELWNVLRSKFYAPVHLVRLKGSIAYVRRVSGSVYVKFRAEGRNVGTVPERGSFRWTIRDKAGRLIKSGRWSTETVYPGGVYWHNLVVRLGYASRLAAGTYTLRVRFETASRLWRAPDVGFRQPY